MHSCSEILAFPLLHRRVPLEVIEVLEVEPLVLAVRFDGSFFAASDDSVNVIVDNQAVWGQKALESKKKRKNQRRKRKNSLV